MNGCDTAQREIAPGLWGATPPERASWWLQRKQERACRHHWHSADAMIRWFCCNCGADRDGMPKDGYDLTLRRLVGRVLHLCSVCGRPNHSARWKHGDEGGVAE